MKHSAATLEDKYQVDSDRFYLTGSQALVRLPLLQRQLDQLAGLNTGGYISGYQARVRMDGEEFTTRGYSEHIDERHPRRPNQ